MTHRGLCLRVAIHRDILGFITVIDQLVKAGVLCSAVEPVIDQLVKAGVLRSVVEPATSVCCCLFDYLCVQL